MQRYQIWHVSTSTGRKDLYGVDCTPCTKVRTFYDFYDLTYLRITAVGGDSKNWTLVYCSRLLKHGRRKLKQSPYHR